MSHTCSHPEIILLDQDSLWTKTDCSGEMIREVLLGGYKDLTTLGKTRWKVSTVYRLSKLDVLLRRGSERCDYI